MFIQKSGGITPTSVLLYIAMIVNSLVIATAFHIVVLAIGILSTEVDHTIMIYRDITRLGTFPVDIYIQPIQFIFTFIIPIGIMMTFPVKSLLSLLNPMLYVISFGLGIVGLFIAMRVWRFALRKYQSWGG
ncbi:ABC-2 family transporter protein [Candidatus Woesebacteria bacterium]|nr:ABC-2 family transporter protein [Candidatus Woesebacteria bacterium]